MRSGVLQPNATIDGAPPEPHVGPVLAPLRPNLLLHNRFGYLGVLFRDRIGASVYSMKTHCRRLPHGAIGTPLAMAADRSGPERKAARTATKHMVEERRQDPKAA